MKKPEIPDSGDMRFGERVRECLLILLGRRTNRIDKVFEKKRSTLKVSVFTKNLADATGSNTYSLGFRPAAMIGLFGQSTTVLKSVAVGVTDFSTMGTGEARQYDAVAYVSSAIFGIIRDATSGDNQTVLSVPVATDDGFTLSWTKAGAPTATGTFIILAFSDWSADMVASQVKINEILELLHGPYQ